jgi:hypothetical protein
VGSRADLDAMENKKLAPASNRTPAAQPIIRRYTDCSVFEVIFKLYLENGKSYGVLHYALFSSLLFFCF